LVIIINNDSSPQKGAEPLPYVVHGILTQRGLKVKKEMNWDCEEGLRGI
jgi:hypothetical protein